MNEKKRTRTYNLCLPMRILRMLNDPNLLQEEKKKAFFAYALEEIPAIERAPASLLLQVLTLFERRGSFWKPTGDVLYARSPDGRDLFCLSFFVSTMWISESRSSQQGVQSDHTNGYDRSTKILSSLRDG